jgi:hypothetical protein
LLNFNNQQLRINIQGLVQAYQTLNNIPIDMLIDKVFKIFPEEEYLDQQLLNYLHAEWAGLQTHSYHIQQKRKQYPGNALVEAIHDMYPDCILYTELSNLFDKTGHRTLFDSVNQYIHLIEGYFSKVRATSNDHFMIDNIFTKDCLSNDKHQIQLGFNHLGRTLYNKFINHDYNLDHNDENSFDQLLGVIDFRLEPSQTIHMSKEYVDWCESHGRKPLGDSLNIGIIDNLQNNLYNYRLLLYRNSIKNNSFSIHIY